MTPTDLRSLARRYPPVRAVLYPLILLRRWRRKNLSSAAKNTLRDLGGFLVGDPVITVPEFQGIFAVSVQSHLLSRLVVEKRYEDREAGLCLRYLNPERDVIDVGANVGFYTVLCAKNTTRGRVLAVEPTPEALGRLRRNIRLNRVADQVEIYAGVISDREGEAEIRILKGREEYSSIGAMAHPSIGGGDWVTEKVASTTLDALVERRSLDPGFIKLDVEGAEHLALAGAKRVLEANRPILLSEVDDFLLRKNGSSAAEIIRLIAGYEYNVFDTVSLAPVSEMDTMGNLLCFPKELPGPAD